MSIASEKVIFGIMIAVVAILISGLAVSAYKWVCLSDGDNYMGVTCVTGHPLSGVCISCTDDSGYSTNPAHCGNITQPSCAFSSTSCYPASTRNCTQSSGLPGIKICTNASIWGSCGPLTGTGDPVTLARIAALEQWSAQVNSNLTALNSRVTLLEQWKLTIQATINSLTGWISYSTSSTFCQIVNSCGGGSGGSGGNNSGTLPACYSNSGCGIDTSIGQVYCSGNAIYQNYTKYTCANPGTAQASCSSLVVPTLLQSCNSTQTCQAGACITPDTPQKVVIFRTNAATQNDYGSYGSEIVLDSNGDGVLECFKYSTFYTNYFESMPTVLVKTPEGYNVNKYSTGRVIIAYGQKYIYAPATNCVTPTTTVPTPPYSTNGRETYKW